MSEEAMAREVALMREELEHAFTKIDTLRGIVDGIEKREQEKCTHDYEEGNCLMVCKQVTNGIEVQVKDVPFGMPVLVQTNMSWAMRVCRLCGDFMVKLPKKVTLA